ncbi:hypothetical protein [Acaryochloris sp. CCMEE 5410]|uniref:hypothetical protein n=1 Tax=Acaryochloris sp. CCMEE 5410 TaxID=310037 RepID=UPI0021D3B471|nr:hypothetical protein [Acaryochloris sp. CCMEE 5410]KAI9129105.1 hypothetical protein ON05_036575 [Acaryochloris sp. CCMEE 5410]
MLEREPRLEATTLFETLQRTILGNMMTRSEPCNAEPLNGGSSWQAQRSDVQNSTSSWGDGTVRLHSAQRFSVTVQGEAFHHILYHYRLSYSGWQYVQVIQGERVYRLISRTTKCLICLWWCA